MYAVSLQWTLWSKSLYLGWPLSRHPHKSFVQEHEASPAVNRVERGPWGGERLLRGFVFPCRVLLVIKTILWRTTVWWLHILYLLTFIGAVGRTLSTSQPERSVLPSLFLCPRALNRPKSELMICVKMISQFITKIYSARLPTQIIPQPFHW